MSEYDFQIKHIEGKGDKVVEALIYHANLLYETIRKTYKSNLEEKIINAEKTDKEYKKLKENTA